MVEKSIQNQESLRIFSLNGNLPLANKIVDYMDLELNKCYVKQFSDGEIQINIEESVRGKDVFVVQATSNPVNDYLFELLIMIDALKRASARTINVVMPYYGYARQDRTARPREPITAKLVANMIEKAGATRVLVFDLHAVQVQGFFDIPVDNLFAMPLFAKYYQDLGYMGDDFVVVAPKNSGVQRARSLAQHLDTTIAIVDNESSEGFENEEAVIGNVEGKTCILVDDIVNTGTTLSKAADILKKAGATDIYACATHGVFSEEGLERIEKSQIQLLSITDSIDTPNISECSNVNVITCSALIGEAIQRIYENKPMSPLFRCEDEKN